MKNNDKSNTTISSSAVTTTTTTNNNDNKTTGTTTTKTSTTDTTAKANTKKMSNNGNSTTTKLSNSSESNSSLLLNKKNFFYKIILFLVIFFIVPYYIGYSITMNNNNNYNSNNKGKSNSSKVQQLVKPYLQYIIEPLYTTLIYFAILDDEQLQFNTIDTVYPKSKKSKKIQQQQQRETTTTTAATNNEQMQNPTDNNTKQQPSTTSSSNNNKCIERFHSIVNRVLVTESVSLDNISTVSIFVHKNGEGIECGILNNNNNTIISAFERLLLKSYTNDNYDCNDDTLFENKYMFESLLTEVIAQYVYDTCTSPVTNIEDNNDNKQQHDGFYKYCDMGENKTPILPDHNELIPIEYSSTGDYNTIDEEYLPCHYHTKSGIRIKSLTNLILLLIREPKQIEQLQTIIQLDNERNGKQQIETQNQSNDCFLNEHGELIDPTCTTTTTATTVNDDVNMNKLSINTTSTDTTTTRSSTTIQFHIYAVQAGRLFVHSTSYIDEIIPLPHVLGGNSKQPVYLKVLSLQPKVYDILNFFSLSESNIILQNALSETKESHRIKRSSTGAHGYNLYDKRTSESGFDTDTPTSIAIKKRGFDILGFDTYIESFADGLQILRYNLTKAYIPHLDWIDGNDQLEHNYESSLQGGNRFATILLYFTDLGPNDGGETVFTETYPPHQRIEDRIDHTTALRQLRESPEGKVLQQGSWEEDMVTKCRTKLAIRPQAARAVLFYSQLPNGNVDSYSLHGGCPVLNGTKYAANLWVWNTARDGYPNNPKNPNYKGEITKSEEVKQQEHPGKVNGVFTNTKSNPNYEFAELYYIDTFWGKFGFHDPSISVNTYPSHVWNVKVNGITVQTFTITTSDPQIQHYEI